MPKFRKRPVIIEAVMWNGLNRGEISDFMGQGVELELESETAYLAGQAVPIFSVLINTLEGTMKGMPGDWIIKGINGEFYPCKPDVFEKSYEPAE